MKPGRYRRGVGLMVRNSQGKIFMGARHDNPQDAWQMPQGGIENQENPDQAALRELKEETGMTSVKIIMRTPNWIRYDFPPSLSAKLWEGSYVGQEQIWYLLNFFGRDEEVNIAQNPPEFRAWRWVDPQEVSRLIVDFKRDAYQQVIKFFASHL